MGRDARFGVVFLAQPVISLIWYNDSRFFGVDGCEGEVLAQVRDSVYSPARSNVRQGFLREHFGNSLEQC